MRHTMTLAAALALWAAPALASHITPQTFATTPADPPARAPDTAPAPQGHSDFAFYTPMPPAPANVQTAPATQPHSAFPFYTPMPPAPAHPQTAPGNVGSPTQ